MRILIYGAGVIGSIFAGKLANAGCDVTVLARGRRLNELTEKGVVLVQPGNNKTEKERVTVIEALQSDDIYDYVFVVMQKTQVDSVLPVLAQNGSTNIVFVVNTAAGYEKWAEVVGKERLMIGFPSAGGERLQTGEVIYFVGHGLMRAFQTTTFGEYSGEKTQRLKTLLRLFNRWGIPSVYYADMNSWQKTHVAMVTAIANAFYKHGGSNYELAGFYADVKLMIKAVKEGFAALNTLGYKTAPSKLCFFRLPASILAFVFKMVLKTKLAEITLAKHANAAKPELRCLQEELDRLIEKSGIKTPAIDELREHLY